MCALHPRTVLARACARISADTIHMVRTILARGAAIAAIPTALTGCYVVPMNPDGSPAYPAFAIPAPVGVVPGPAPAHGSATQPAQLVTGGPLPTSLPARLYPANAVATETGMLTGSVTNMMNGKGRFQLDYKGELLIGEATRLSNDERSGIANAYGARGTYMTCTYKMSTPYQGAGTCNLSNGAAYDVHLGG